MVVLDAVNRQSVEYPLPPPFMAEYSSVIRYSAMLRSSEDAISSVRIANSIIVKGFNLCSQLQPNTIQKDKKFRSIIILSDDEKNKTC